jgi:hypothetical protein
MKIKLTLSLALFLIGMLGYSQNNPSISFKLKNSSIFPKNITLISYMPGDSGNGTQGVWMWPGSTKEFNFKEGTKLYFANRKQVSTVMSGSRIDTEKPFLVVAKETANSIVKF